MEPIPPEQIEPEGGGVYLTRFCRGCGPSRLAIARRSEDLSNAKAEITCGRCGHVWSGRITAVERQLWEQYLEKYGFIKPRRKPYADTGTDKGQDSGSQGERLAGNTGR